MNSAAASGQHGQLMRMQLRTGHLSRLNSAQVPPLFDKEAVRERLHALPGGPTQPLTVHLRQEIDRLNTVIALTTATLRNLRLAIAGASDS